MYTITRMCLCLMILQIRNTSRKDRPQTQNSHNHVPKSWCENTLHNLSLSFFPSLVPSVDVRKQLVGNFLVEEMALRLPPILDSPFKKTLR